MKTIASKGGVKSAGAWTLRSLARVAHQSRVSPNLTSGRSVHWNGQRSTVSVDRGLERARSYPMIYRWWSFRIERSNLTVTNGARRLTFGAQQSTARVTRPGWSYSDEKFESPPRGGFSKTAEIDRETRVVVLFRARPFYEYGRRFRITENNEMNN